MSATRESASEEASQAAGGPAGPPAGGSSIYDASTPVGRVALAFKRAMVAMRRLRGRESQRIGQLSFAQLGLLHGLAGGGECSARQLAEHSDLSPATVTQMLESMEAAGLVTRTRSEQDRRVVHTVLTEQGAALVEGRQRDMEQRWRAALGEFSVEELAIAARILDRIGEMVETLGREEAAQPR
jgi:DNA-binding MarR family transcriptional regulator